MIDPFVVFGGSSVFALAVVGILFLLFAFLCGDRFEPVFAYRLSLPLMALGMAIVSLFFYDHWALSVLLIGIFRHADEFNRVGVLKKFHFCLPVIELVLIAALMFITCTNSTAGWNSVMSLLVGGYAPLFWIGLVLIGLVLPTALETWLLFFSPKEFEESRKAHWISAASDAGVLVGGFLLRYLVVVAALPLTMVVPML